MDFLASPIQISVVTASALLAAMIGLFALLRRGQYLTTLLFSSAFISMAAFLAGTLGTLHGARLLQNRYVGVGGGVRFAP